jgi:FkbM family methyltransferase
VKLLNSAWRTLTIPWRWWRAISRDPVSKELARIAAVPRYTPLTSNVFGFPLAIPDGASFCSCYREVFENEIYAFQPTNGRPFIIDAGANIGLAVIYFKQRFPGSRILAIEADPRVFGVLRENVAAAGYRDVTLVNKAVWTSEAGIDFSQEGADAGRIPRSDDAGVGPKIRVATLRLSTLLTSRVDFLKLDIEGAEVDVLLESASLLHNVEHLFVEYHSFEREPQRLDTLIALLREHGFRVYIHTAVCPPRPFLQRTSYLGMDLQLNIFAVRAPIAASQSTGD